MIRLWSSFLYPLVLGFLLGLIFKFYEMKRSYLETKTLWMKLFLEKFVNVVFIKNLKSSPPISRKVEAMNIRSNKEFSEMSKIEKWQHFLRRKFQQMENEYYPIVDDLVQKLADLDGIDVKQIPNLDIAQFSFIKEWQDGNVTSEHVLAILKTLSVDKVAETQLTRRLTNYMLNKENTVVGDYVRPCRSLILKQVVPLYVAYLDMLHKYFEKLVEIDSSQEKVTWIEQICVPDTPMKVRAEDLSLNQVIRQLDHQVIPFNSTRYFVGDNILCLDEELTKGAYAVHWIFAPKCYIDELKRTFKIKDVMDIKQEAQYIQKIIGAYIHGKV